MNLVVVPVEMVINLVVVLVVLVEMVINQEVEVDLMNHPWMLRQMRNLQSTMVNQTGKILQERNLQLMIKLLIKSLPRMIKNNLKNLPRMIKNLLRMSKNNPKILKILKTKRKSSLKSDRKKMVLKRSADGWMVSDGVDHFSQRIARVLALHLL